MNKGVEIDETQHESRAYDDHAEVYADNDSLQEDNYEDEQRVSADEDYRDDDEVEDDDLQEVLEQAGFE